MGNSLERPKINIPKTTSERIWNFIGSSFFLGSIIFLIIIWSKLPEKIPGHYNSLGEVDRLGSKWELLILIGVGALIYFLMHTFERYPEVHNYPKTFNKSNANQFYLNSRKLVNQLKNICLVIIALILFESVWIALGWANGFGTLFLPIVTIGLMMPIVIAKIMQKRIK